MIVVTGASGFIGAHLVAALRRRGERVLGIDRRPGADVVADLTDRRSDALDVLTAADAVFHLAGRAGARDASPAAERRWWRDNVLATEVVLGVVDPGVPLVVTSSSSVYGGVSCGRASDERDPVRPHGGYARSKAEVERRCRARAARGGAVAIVRPFTVVGEGQRPDMAVARWIAAAEAGEPLRVLGSLERRRDVTDVADVVRALLAVADRSVSGTVNVGTGVSHRLADIVAAVTEVVAPAPVMVESPWPGEPDETRACTDRCASWLGFRPATNLRSVVRRQAAARLRQPGSA